MFVMASTSLAVIPTEGLMKFRLFYFIRKWGKEVMLSLFKWFVMDNEEKQIHEILQDNGISLRRLDSQERKKIASGVPPETLDITALYKIFLLLWEKGVKDPGDKLKDLIRNIKSERNAVSHEEGTSSSTEIEAKLREFGGVLEETLDEALSLHPCHALEINQLKKSINKAVPEIQEKIREKYDPSNPEDWKRLQSELEEFGTQLTEYINGKVTSSLALLYKDHCKILPFDWLCQYGATDPCCIVVSLKMDTDVMFQGSHLSHKLTAVDQSDLLNTRDARGNDPKVIIISGDAGTGKTTLLSSIMEQWYKEEASSFIGLASYSILLHMEFRKNDYDNFDDYLSDLLQPLVIYFGYERIKSSFLQTKCLILCDGFDERNDRSLKLFEEILNLKLSTVKVVVTTRPVNTVELSRVVNESKSERVNLSILGIREEDRDFHVTKLINHLILDEAISDNLIKEITTTLQSVSPEMKLILQNPLHFNLFILLYVECPDLRGTVNTVTMFYSELVKHKFERLMVKLGIKESERNVLSEFDDFYRKWSLEYHLQHKYELTQGDIGVFKEKCLELELNFESVMSNYFSMRYSRRGLGLVKIYCYRHRTEQEFAAASAICDMIISFCKDDSIKFAQLNADKKSTIRHILSSTKYVNENKDSRIEKDHLLEVLRFVTGILYFSERDLLYEVIDDILSMVYMIDAYEVDKILVHLVEANNDTNILKAVVRKLKGIVHSKELHLKILESKNLQCLPLVLPRVQPATLSLYLKDSPDNLQHLIPALEMAVQNNNEINLHLYHHYQWKSNNYSDRYLKIARTCINFDGKLSESGIGFIPACIEKLRIEISFHALKTLSMHLPSLTKLIDLGLHLHFDSSVNPGCLSPLEYEGENFDVFFENESVMDQNTTKNVADIINALWPDKRSKSFRTSLYMASKFTGATLKLLMESLDIKPLRYLTIQTVTKDAMEKVEEFTSLSQSIGLGYLLLSSVG